MLIRIALSIILLLPGAGTAHAQPCEITGTIPETMHEALCKVATSAHGSEGPRNLLVISVTREVAYAMRLQTPDTDNFMLLLLDLWMKARDVKVAEVMAFYGRAKLVTAETTFWRGPVVNYH